MKKYGFLILAILVIGAIIYATFVIAVIKIALGLILLGVAAVLLWIFWLKIKKKAEDKF